MTIPLRGLVIGLDGATFDLLRPFIAHGWLPHLQAATQRGAAGVLRSTVPPLTAPAWGTFLTGVNPGKHGVFSFQRRRPGSMAREFIDGTALRGPRLWHWLAQHGLATACVNMPISWPPEPMPAGGWMITGMLTPDTEHPFTYPPDLAEGLRRAGYICDIRIKLHERDVATAEGLTAVARDLHTALLRREAALFRLLAERPVDVLVVVFETMDRLQHYAWRVLEELAAEGDAAARRSTLHATVLACYREVDRVVGRLLAELTGPETPVFFVSDHGFGPLRRRFHVDAWLAQQGWLRYAAGRATLRRRLRGPVQRVKRLLPRSLLLRGRRALATAALVDWSHTRVYSGRSMEHAIYVNLAGREPQGVVPADEYDALRRAVADALLALQDPATGRPAVQAVYPREALYSGPYVAEAPDLLLALAPGYEPSGEPLAQGCFSDAAAEGAGIHQPDGVFIALGPGVRAGAALPPHDIADALPTLLYALGLPVPTALDGRVIEAAFDPTYLQRRPPVHADLPLPAVDLGEAGGYTDADAARVEERLAALGYLG
ncbi:MAG: alkaline phosphatase family protein [Caldilineales bacterium]|nr:alkaline phosphatase family protein [Caldilineales bacterium]MDW8316411.1 alkaline phosphatase family protein [Anaerolineae bacterium]